MQIKFNPQRRNDTLNVEKQGDKLIVNGVEYDFTSIPEGATLPADAIGSDLFSGNVERVGGALKVTLTLPHGPNPSKAVAFPEPINVVSDGPVALPQ